MCTGKGCYLPLRIQHGEEPLDSAGALVRVVADGNSRGGWERLRNAARQMSQQVGAQQKVAQPTQRRKRVRIWGKGGKGERGRKGSFVSNNFMKVECDVCVMCV